MLPLLALGALGGEEESHIAPAQLRVRSTLDGAEQPCFFLPSAVEGDRPLLVWLHPWSHGYDTFGSTDWQQAAAARGWHLLIPHFRGPNKNPEACGSPEARQDILDAIDHVCARYPVDLSRVYLAGGSGGGHMSMVMAGHAPERWAAVSAWCGISDLAAWHRECRQSGRRYWKDIKAVAGGAPGSSADVDREIHFRSPVHALARAKDLPLDISTGIHDGHTGSVPIHHTIDAFNRIAGALGADPVSPDVIHRLSLERPLDTSEEQDATYGRRIYLRRYAGPSRVTIFEGGHEAIPEAACAWLATHARD